MVSELNAIQYAKYLQTSGFWPRVRARALRAPVFFGLINTPNGRCAPPPHRSFAAPPKIENKLFPETKCFPSGPNLGRQGRIPFHWSKLHLTELRCTPLSNAAPYWATLHPIELRCTLISYAAFNWAMPHPIGATPHPIWTVCCTLWAKLPLFWASLHPSELCCTRSDYAGP
jgi:hypothetical protein